MGRDRPPPILARADAAEDSIEGKAGARVGANVEARCRVLVHEGHVERRAHVPGRRPQSDSSPAHALRDPDGHRRVRPGEHLGVDVVPQRAGAPLRAEATAEHGEYATGSGAVAARSRHGRQRVRQQQAGPALGGQAPGQHVGAVDQRPPDGEPVDLQCDRARADGQLELGDRVRTAGGEPGRELQRALGQGATVAALPIADGDDGPVTHHEQGPEHLPATGAQLDVTPNPLVDLVGPAGALDQEPEPGSIVVGPDEAARRHDRGDVAPLAVERAPLPAGVAAVGLMRRSAWRGDGLLPRTLARLRHTLGRARTRAAASAAPVVAADPFVAGRDAAVVHGRRLHVRLRVHGGGRVQHAAIGLSDLDRGALVGAVLLLGVGAADEHSDRHNDPGTAHTASRS